MLKFKRKKKFTDLPFVRVSILMDYIWHMYKTLVLARQSE